MKKISLKTMDKQLFEMEESVMEFEIIRSFFNEQQCIRRHNGVVAECVGGAAVVHNWILQGPCRVSKEKVTEIGGEDGQQRV